MMKPKKGLGSWVLIDRNGKKTFKREIEIRQYMSRVEMKWEWRAKEFDGLSNSC